MALVRNACASHLATCRTFRKPCRIPTSQPLCVRTKEASVIPRSSKRGSPFASVAIEPSLKDLYSDDEAVCRNVHGPDKTPPRRDESRSTAIWAKVLAAMLAVCALCATASPAYAAESVCKAANPLKGFASFMLHLDVHLGQIIARYGNITYAILFGIVFCETGLIITPFLPGDSLLFAAGAFASLGHLHLSALLVTFISSAVLGDWLNYQLGKYFGAKVKDSALVKREYFEKTEAFYKKYGGKTVVLARFIPIIRTFAPFVAGVGSMSFQSFSAYNIGGAVLWSVLFVGGGALLGNVPAVKHNFSIVIFAIIGVSSLPVVFEAYVANRKGKYADPFVET